MPFISIIFSIKFLIYFDTSLGVRHMVIEGTWKQTSSWDEDKICFNSNFNMIQMVYKMSSTFFLIGAGIRQRLCIVFI